MKQIVVMFNFVLGFYIFNKYKKVGSKKYVVIHSFSKHTNISICRSCDKTCWKNIEKTKIDFRGK